MLRFKDAFKLLNTLCIILWVIRLVRKLFVVIGLIGYKRALIFTIGRQVVYRATTYESTGKFPSYQPGASGAINKLHYTAFGLLLYFGLLVLIT